MPYIDDTTGYKFEFYPNRSGDSCGVRILNSAKSDSSTHRNESLGVIGAIIVGIGSTAKVVGRTASGTKIGAVVGATGGAILGLPGGLLGVMGGAELGAELGATGGATLGSGWGAYEASNTLRAYSDKVNAGNYKGKDLRADAVEAGKDLAAAISGITGIKASPYAKDMVTEGLKR